MGMKFEERYSPFDDMKWDGMTPLRIERYNLNFYLVFKYNSEHKLFLFYVIVQGGMEEAGRFTATIKLKNEKSILWSFKGPVLSLDKLPDNDESLIDSPACFSVLYRAMRDVFIVTQDRKDNMYSVDFIVGLVITKECE